MTITGEEVRSSEPTAGLDELLGFGLLGSAFSILICADASGEMSMLNGDGADRRFADQSPQLGELPFDDS